MTFLSGGFREDFIDINLNGNWSLTDNIVFASAPSSSSSGNSAGGDGTDPGDGNQHSNGAAVTISHTVGGNRTTTGTVATNGTHDYHYDVAHAMFLPSGHRHRIETFQNGEYESLANVNDQGQRRDRHKGQAYYGTGIKGTGIKGTGIKGTGIKGTGIKGTGIKDRHVIRLKSPWRLIPATLLKAINAYSYVY